MGGLVFKRVLGKYKPDILLVARGHIDISPVLPIKLTSAGMRRRDDLPALAIPTTARDGLK